MNNYIEILIDVPYCELRDMIIAQLSELGYDGFEEKHDQLLAIAREKDFDAEVLQTILDQYSLTYTTTTIPFQNWNALWESNFEPVLVDDLQGKPLLHIRADFHQPNGLNVSEIVINPKMSFGTGHHATTFLMVQKMAELDFNHKKVLDFGSGTGILAIYATKLGAASVLAIDNDSTCTENGLENAAINQAEKIRFNTASAIEEGEVYDIILANINLHVILGNLPAIKNALAPTGTVLFSGLLSSDQPQIEAAISTTALSIVSISHKNNWMVMEATKASHN